MITVQYAEDFKDLIAKMKVSDVMKFLDNTMKANEAEYVSIEVVPSLDPETFKPHMQYVMKLLKKSPHG
jgi:hypothetical protein